MDQVKIGKYIQNLRKKNNLTQSEFGELFGVSDKAVSNWENGKALPDIQILYEISKHFDKNIDDIINCTDDCKIQKNHDKTKALLFISLLFNVILIVFIIFWLFNCKQNTKIYKLKSESENINFKGVLINDNKNYQIDINTINCKEVYKIKYYKIEIFNENNLLYESNKNIESTLCDVLNGSEISIRDKKVKVDKGLEVVLTYVTNENENIQSTTKIDINSI